MQGKTADAIERIGAVAAATVSALDPVTGVFATVLKEAHGRFVRKKIEDAGRILEEEILRDPHAIERLKKDPESTAARTFRYIRAATVGTAHENLRILARLVVHGDGSQAIPADDFLYYAQTIESLRHDELVVLAEFLRVQGWLDRPSATSPPSLWKGVQQQLAHFNEVKLLGLANALLRTGFLATVQRGAAGTSWMVTPELTRLQATTQFTQAVADAKASG